MREFIALAVVVAGVALAIYAGVPDLIFSALAWEFGLHG